MKQLLLLLPFLCLMPAAQARFPSTDPDKCEALRKEGFKLTNDQAAIWRERVLAEIDLGLSEPEAMAVADALPEVKKIDQLKDRIQTEKLAIDCY